jgi:purine-cytosine permease-like protein
MSEKSGLKAITERLDALYEFDRAPVTEDRLQSGTRFAALFAGEHVAGTEFVIGAMFVLHGVSATDLVFGLLLGNLLAVLSWTFICAPIGVKIRLTLYWHLHRIGGPGITFIYNIANAFLYCILAGAMISVAATAVGLAFGVDTPALDAKLPTGVGWVAITLAVGAVVTVVAVLGFEILSEFSSVCSPWMLLVFFAGAIAVLPQIGEFHNASELWELARAKIWNGVPIAGQEKFGFWHICFFAWFCNLAMHVDLSDMAVFRYAKSWKYGLYSAFGMFPGHFMAWLASGIMVAAIGLKMSPGQMAVNAAGLAGAVAVVVAGWTTANPTMYRSGLALQTVTPNWPRWAVTLTAGAVTTILSCFPFFFMRLLDFVAIYGLILMPVGAAVFAEFWIIPRIGLTQYRAEQRGWFVSWALFGSWAVTLAACYFMPIHLFFRWLPGYFIALVLYLALAYLEDRLRPATIPAIQGGKP